jgi:selenocysteine lyase/cysteine desulfurase
MWNRREFLRASGVMGTTAVAARATSLAAVAQATSAVTNQPPDAVAQNETYWREVRQAFTLDPALINLNNGNSSPSPRIVHEAFKRYLDTSNLLPVHYRSLLEQNVDAVRKALASEFGCDPEDLAITRNASEALHTAQCGLDLQRGDEVLTTDQDYTRMLWAWDQRVRRDGITVKRIQFPVPTTADDLMRRFEQAITPRTRVMHFCHVTNVTGQLFPVRDLCRLARSRSILTIVDGAQAVGHFPFVLRDLDCDFYGTSLHKWMMAPHGTGFLYVRREHLAKLWPLQPALPSMGGNIRKFEEIGTHPAAAAAAIVDALAFNRMIGADRKAARLRYLTMRWANALKTHPRVTMLTSLEPGQSWALATAQFQGLSARALERHLMDRHHIVIAAEYTQGLPGPVFEFEGLRVTPHVYTSIDEIDRFVAAMQDVLANGLPRA